MKLNINMTSDSAAVFVSRQAVVMGNDILWTQTDSF